MATTLDEMIEIWLSELEEEGFDEEVMEWIRASIINEIAWIEKKAISKGIDPMAAFVMTLLNNKTLLAFAWEMQGFDEAQKSAHELSLRVKDKVGGLEFIKTDDDNVGYG